MLPENDYRYMIEDSETDAIIVSSSRYKTIKNAIKKSKSKANIIVSGNKITSEISFDELLKEPEVIEVGNTKRDDICLWMYSSGSTGNPKGTLHTHKNLMATANCYAKKVLKITSKDISGHIRFVFCKCINFCKNTLRISPIPLKNAPLLEIDP